jgi:5-methyltetrahydrofolate--homocysteine methyltransferase
MPDLQELGEAIKRGDRETSATLTKAAIAARVPAQEILDVMVGAMDVVGQQFQKNKAVIGTVEGDLHDIGKNLVAMMWKGANFDVIDLGTNVSPQKFVDAVRTNNAQLVGLSALLTTTMPAIKTTVAAIKAAGLNVTKVVFGGAAVTQEYADEIGADGYAPDAASAVNVARTLL